MFSFLKRTKKKAIELHYEGEVYTCKSSETVLDCLERNECHRPSSCRTGVCHSCVMRVKKGEISSISTDGLSAEEKAKGYFLPCVCQPKENLHLSDVDAPTHEVDVLHHEKINERVWRLRLSRPDSFHYQAGQFISVDHAGLVRSYSLASIPSDDFLELHILQVPQGQMSRFLCQEITVGHSLNISDPVGSCFYNVAYMHQPLILIGTGTGLAPLYGIVKDALNQAHQADIYLYHGSLVQKDLYLMRELTRMMDLHDNFHYVPCVLNEEAPEGGLQGNLEAILPQQHDDLSASRLFICGNPEIVQSIQNVCVAKGMPLDAILTDVFA
ncbi:MAG: FAD-binding oxidoreductase [Mariprofundaceae bacterium]|nr:FAD-binding oxidoreductase [Mariprofundaceae bacterium]